MDKYSLVGARELAQMSMETYYTIDHWSSMGLLIFSQRNGRRLYPVAINLSRIRRIRELQTEGYTLTTIRAGRAGGWKNEEDRSDLALTFDSISRQLVKFLARHPDHLYTLSPRKFEELIAEIVRDMGYEVELTQISRDGGRDVLAYLATPLGRELTIIECKKYQDKNRIGVELVRQFLWVLEREDQANRGLIATTSYFSLPAFHLEKEHRWRLGLRDFAHITEWLANYGKWENRQTSGLWSPKRAGKVE